jgi:hypothetical protein
MIKVFSGDWRGLGSNDKEPFMLMAFKFRDIIHLFKKAKLSVFLVLILHSDKEGLSFPSYDLLEKETGYNRSTIARALDELCEMKIDGKRVLMRYRERNENGMFVGSNRYRIFPTENEIEEEADPQLQNATPNQDQSTVAKCNYGTPENHSCKNQLSQNATISINHNLSINQLNTNCAESTDAVEKTSEELWEEIERNSPFKKGDFLETVKLPPPKSGDELDGMIYFSNLSKGVDVSHYPEDIQPVLLEIFKFWKILPPGNEKDKGTRSQKALWIKEARALLRTFGEFGFKVLYEVFREWNKEKRLTISRPGSLINLCTAKAGLMRQKYSAGLQPNTEQYDPEAVKKFQTQLKKRKNQPSQVEVDSPY